MPHRNWLQNLNDDVQSAHDVGNFHAVPDILKELQHADYRNEEVVFNLRGTDYEALKALIMGAISTPDFGNLRERVRFVE